METAMNRKKGGKRLYQNVECRRNEATESKHSESSTSEKHSSGDDFDSNWHRNTWCGIGKNNVETVERNYSFLEKDENKFFVGTRGSEPSGLYEQNVRKMHDIDKQTKMFPRFIDFTSKCNVEHRSDVHNPSLSSKNTDTHGNNLDYSRKVSNKLFKNRIHYNTNERDEQIWQVISGSTDKLKLPVIANQSSDTVHNTYSGESTHLFTSNFDSPVLISDKYQSLNAVCVSSENTSKLKTSVSQNWNSDSDNERHVSTSFFSHSVDPRSLNAVSVNSENTSKLKIPVSENWNSDFYNERYVSTGLFSQNVNPHSLITKCLSEVTYWTDSCLANHGRELGKISFHVGRAKDTEGILNTLRSRKTNMSSQQKCFHNFVRYVHNEMNELYNEYDSGVITRKTNELLSYTKDECKLFSNMSPAYCLKQELETALMSSQVTIITCDVMYRSNIVIPLLLRGTFSSGTIASCEVNEAVALFSAQNCCHMMDQKLGKLVGYDIEKEILGSKNTKIVYTTVQKLLSYSMDDPLLPKFSCVILNDFLYRSIEADILLTSLRECLNKRDDLKILILMVTKHNIENLKYFFSRKSGDVCVINTENLNFPVQTVWKKSFCNPDDDIILEAVDMCFAIHVSRLNEEGNVLVFLPTEEDALEVTELTTKKCCEYSFTDVFCTYVNEKNKVKKILQIQEQQQQSKRVIIFVKGGFEVVFFPNVYYVVDFGRTSQISYDTEKKIEVQKRSFISRSRSEIIKKCVGTYVSGICFRMYSKKNYKRSMVYNESPEVLRRSPLNSLVKIFKYRPDSTLPVRFVEPLSQQVNENALNALQSLGALENGKLTQLGKCLVKLPFPPEYSKLIIIGKQKGLLFEVIILVSFFLAEISDIFQDKSTNDLQKKVDAAKLRFLQSDSDTLTFLNIYVQWIKNECSKSWCVDNYIEFNCLDCVRIKITEVCETVKKILGETILQKFSNDYQITPGVCSSLQLIIFECFRDNLCVYSGHFVGGYRYPIAHCTVFLHPSTFIVEKRKLPQFIVYDKFISKTCNFITHVTAIPDSYVIDAFDRGLLKVKRCVLFDQKLVPHVIEPVGLSLIKCALTKEKLGDLEEQIKRETRSKLIVIEPFIEKASVTLYCLPDNWGKAEKIMRKFLDENIEKFWEEEEIQVLEFRKGDTTVLVNIVWSKGAEISSVEVAHQDTTLDSQSESSRDICFRQTTTSPSETNATQSCILLTWLRRPCVGDGFVEFNNFEDFSRARRLALRTIQVRGTSAEVGVSQHEKYRLFVHHLCPETTEQDLKVAFQELLVGISPSDVKVRRRSPFKTTSDDIECIEKSFREQIHCIFGRNVIKVKIHEPENNEEVIMSAEVQPIGSCMNMFSLENLAVFMNGSLKVHDVSVEAEVSYFSLLFCSTEVWDKIQPSICSLYNAYVKELRMNDQNCDLEAKALDSQTQRLKISSENEANVIELRKIIQNQLEGCIITSADNNYLPMLFCHGGQVFLDALKNRTNVHVIDDYKTKTLRLYGAEENCKVARHDIMEYLSQMKVETVKIVSLDRGKSSRTLLKNIIQTYDVELKQFIEVSQLRSAELDIKKCELTLHGSAESIEEAEALLEKLEESESDSTSSTVSDEETCPICLSGVFTHGIRLESCGHLFCRICCQGTMQKPKFPVQCSFPGCGKAIILEDIRRTLDYNEEMIKEVLRKSLRKFLDDHSNFAYCPAPDCTMFVNKETITDTKWKCQLCHNDICLDCRVIYHEGYSCDMYQKMKIDPDHQFRVWQENPKTVNNVQLVEM